MGSKFSLPDKSEGFDEIRYAWQQASAVNEYFTKWMLQKKTMERVEDLQPGSSFKEQWTEWQTLLAQWRKLHSDWKDPARKEKLLEKRREDKAQKRADGEAAKKATESKADG